MVHRIPNLAALVDPLLGQPYERFLLPGSGPHGNACWGLVRLLLDEGFGTALDVDPSQAASQIVEVWFRGDARDPLPLVQPWDVWILATKGLWSDHLGLVVNPLQFVHVRKRVGVVVEPLRRWQPKLIQLARLRQLS
jgi:hypothetical protein